jgi:putative transposase
MQTNHTLQTVHDRRTRELRKGRISVPDGRYFLTLCAIRPTSQLTTASVAHAIRSTIQKSVEDRDYALLCGTLMPDHLHLLVQLSHRLSIGQAVGKLKALTRKPLAESGCRWQANFFEHRLRPDEATSLYALYIFLNPYRAGILTRRSVWPWWMKGTASFDFETLLEESRYPAKEWLVSDTQALGIKPDDVGLD